MSRSRLVHQAGFTIVELMIATVIFTVILVVITTGVIRFTSGYYKGLNSSATQTATRTIINDISQAVEYAGGPSSVVQAQSGPQGAICVGNVHFNYTLASVASAGWGVYETTDNVGPDCPTGDPRGDTSGHELLGDHMRVTNIGVTQNGNIWDVTVGIAYADDDSNGDPDLLCATALNGSQGGCQPGDAVLTEGLLADNGDSATCKGQTGEQFCDVVHLSTSVQQRFAAN